ncbi:Protein farnesyltransferase subunit beta [Liparis tanakae]|uniref:Protein farnesyltransferase subunit beta n=1 Tax=Liparis tanakae TaxID=230148 RepID=A0A4Z2EGT8_9TELE|nr:Protein farnesyltransferase subunit beta [Liparis tanakae]
MQIPVHVDPMKTSALRLRLWSCEINRATLKATRWVVSRQMRFEGGFQGRCNKLVDGCYSFWQAGLLPLLHRALFKEGTKSRYSTPVFWSRISII